MQTDGTRRLDPVGVVLLTLVRLTADEAWTPQWAAERLRQRVDDDGVLWRARARVGWALLDRPSRFGERAASTLDVALGLPPAQRPVPAGATAKAASNGDAA